MRGQDNIGDRIPGTDFMEGYIFNFLAMDSGFNLCYQPEYLQRVIAARRIQVGVLQAAPNITVVSMMMVTFLVNRGYREPGSGERAIIVVQGFQFNEVRKPRIDDHLRKALPELWKSIQHSADEHITRQTAYQIEMNMIYH